MIYSHLPPGLTIVADENIPALEPLFGDLGVLKTYPGRTMRSDNLEGADILLVRSVTKVNAELLSKSRVKFVGTCTIGTDHLDKEYFEDAGIEWSAAPGCNAGGVVQYALSAMARYRPDWQNLTIGIVGCGNVGGRLYRTLKALGVDLRVRDPFKSTRTIPELTTLQDVLAADIICMHTPLTREGEYPTASLLNADNMHLLNRRALLLNAGRGEVIDNEALYDFLAKEPYLDVVLDVWAHEPNIHTPLMDRIACGTPHIAGYSFEGKLNGSTMIFEALAKHLGLREELVVDRVASVRKNVLGESVELNADTINSAILQTYDVHNDHALIAEVLKQGEVIGTAFDRLRKGYWQRREFSHFRCNHRQSASPDVAVLDAFWRAVNSVN